MRQNTYFDNHINPIAELSPFPPRLGIVPLATNSIVRGTPQALRR